MDASFIPPEQWLTAMIETICPRASIVGHVPRHSNSGNVQRKHDLGFTRIELFECLVW